MTKYKIIIIDYDGIETIYYRESVEDNFYTAMDSDLTEIFDIISSDECKLYDWEVINVWQ